MDKVRTFSIESKVRVKYNLASERKSGIVKHCDVELVAGGRKDYVHSEVLCMHSNKAIKVLKQQPPPFSWKLNDLEYEILETVVDWMYYNREVSFYSSRLSSYLLVAVYLEMPELHYHLQEKTLELSLYTSSLPYSLEACAQHGKLFSWSTRQTVIDSLLATVTPVPLSPSIAFFLFGFNTDLKKKAAIVTIVLHWLDNHREMAVEVLSSLTNLGAMDRESLRSLRTKLLTLISEGKIREVSLDVDLEGRIVVTQGLRPLNVYDSPNPIVSSEDVPSPTRSSIELNQPLALSPLSELHKKFAALPSVFENEKKPSGNEKKRKIDMEVFLSTTGPPAFVARTPSRHSSLYDSAFLVGAFGEDSMAEINALPDVFNNISSHLPSSYPSTRNAINGRTTVPQSAHPMLHYSNECIPSSMISGNQNKMTEEKGVGYFKPSVYAMRM